MKRRAFTLIELLVSIALFGLIAIFLFGSIDGLRKQQSFIQKKEAVLSRKNQILSLLRTDFDRAKLLSISKSTSIDFDTVLIFGSNRSLYKINQPNVAWIILKADNTLVRLESASPIIIPLTDEAMYFTHADVIGKHCEIFRIYDSAKQRLIYVKFENESPLIVETMK